MSNPKKYFGTDGIRGESGGPVINEDFAYQLGIAVGQQLQKEGHKLGPAYIGRDPRTSGPALRDHIAAGLWFQGYTPVDLGILPTPAVALQTLSTDAILGIVLTASHNPAKDNGFKFFQDNGRKVTPQWEAEVETLLQDPKPAPTIQIPDMQDAHEAALQGFLAHIPQDKLDLGGLTIALDTAAGATCHTTPEILRRLGAKLHPIGAGPDGEQINNGIGSEHPGKIIEAVQSGQAHIGLAHDGDGDRLIVCDEEANLLTGDEVLGILALDRISKGTLPKNTLVGTILCNEGLALSLKQHNGHLLRADVGDRNVTSLMAEQNLNLGGEPSGHFVLADQLPTGCGLHAAIELLKIRQSTGRPLSGLRKQVTLFPQATLNLQVLEKPPLEDLQKFQSGLQKINAHLGDEGRTLVRYSGTEPKVRLLVEALTPKAVQEALAALEYIVRKQLPVTSP